MLTSASSCKTMRVIWAPCRITPACAGNRVQARVCMKPKRGSPPLARGTAISFSSVWSSCRITPACVGNSSAAAILSSGVGDHPRLRGEQFILRPFEERFLGSPPLARGTELKAVMPELNVGITPACAGNRAHCVAACTIVQDHPRLRGEQALGRRYISMVAGSPPLARGTEQSAYRRYRKRRITPACAGNS